MIKKGDYIKIIINLYNRKFSIGCKYKVVDIDSFKPVIVGNDGEKYLLLPKEYVVIEPIMEPIGTPEHYDNTNGSLYKIAQERNWNAYQFDIIKRIDRCEKKGEFKKDLEKTKFLIDLYINGK